MFQSSSGRDGASIQSKRWQDKFQDQVVYQENLHPFSDRTYVDLHVLYIGTYRLCQTVGVSSGGSCDQCLCHGNVSQVYQALFAAMEDYTTDSRGDIGAVVREAAMSGLEEITVMIATREPSLLTEDM